MFPLQRIKGTTSAETIGIGALLGALVLPVIAVVQIAREGVDATAASGAWWLRFGLTEIGFVAVLAALRLQRTEKS